MTAIAYSVFCSILYQTLEQDWLDWMKNTHMPDVLKAGAQSAELIKCDPEREGQVERVYEIRYKFESRGSFEEYLEKQAPRLRRESLEKFPVADGFKYHRTVGEIL